MKPQFQNRINDAIHNGIRYGIDLYDDSIQDLDKDLEIGNCNKDFKALDPYKYLTDENFDAFIRGDMHYSSIFKLLCCNYSDEYYGVYHFKNHKQFLKRLIKYLCFVFGNSINLNWIDVSNVTNMSGMFYNSEFNGDISRWDVSNVHNMSYMFLFSHFNKDISKWDVSKVLNMSLMFRSSKFNGDISKWDVSNVENMASMFENAKFNGDISKWDVSNVSDMTAMFLNNSHFNRDISVWDVSNVQNMAYMFKNSVFDQDISMWDIQNITVDHEIFKFCPIQEKHKPKFR